MLCGRGDRSSRFCHHGKSQVSSGFKSISQEEEGVSIPHILAPLKGVGVRRLLDNLVSLIMIMMVTF